MPTAPAAELFALAVALAATGVIAGLLAGIFGIGGGGVIVPVLYQALTVLGFPASVTMHVAVGSSLAFIIPTSIRSFQAHKARGAVDMALLRSWVISVPAGVIAASFVAALVSGAGMRAIFAGIAFVVGVRLLFNRETWRLPGDVPGGFLRAAAGFLIGLLSALMGVGGGIMANTFMTVYGRPIHQAIATASGVGVLIAIPGTLGYVAAGWGADGLPPLSLGYVNLLAIAIVMPLSFFMAPIGVRIAHALSKRQLEVSFGLFLILMSARFMWSLV
ncbi:MAG: sulfite exporter TauE/SafE family protein [Propylenella sp.]